MKKTLNNSFETMNKIQGENLFTTANESLDINYNPSSRKLFTATDMWYIQRKGKSCIQKRHSF